MFEMWQDWGAFMTELWINLIYCVFANISNLFHEIIVLDNSCIYALYILLLYFDIYYVNILLERLARVFSHCKASCR